MEQYTNEYYSSYHAATTEAERSKIKADFEALFATLTEEQQQEVKTILAKRIDESIAKWAWLDAAIERFEDYLKQGDKQPERLIDKAA